MISGLMKQSGRERSLGDVGDEDPAVNVDLGRGESDARCGIHGLEQIADELPDFVIYPLHRMCSSSQSGVGVFEYVKYCHNHAASCQSPLREDTA
jgi:hypothetical protein